ncbi:S8 family serine peptidase [Streptomyces zhihengii]
MPSAFLVPADAADGDRPAGRVRHVYANGAAVVETPAAGRAGTALPEPGLRLPHPGAGPSAIAEAERSIREAAGRPDSEDEADTGAYVEFVAPPDPRWLAELGRQGIRILAYQPENSYLVRGRRGDLARLAGAVRTSEGDSAVRTVTELTPALKPAPRTLAEAGETAVVVLAATDGERQALTRALGDVSGVELLPGAGNDVLDGQRTRVRVRVDEQGLGALLALPHVLSVESFAAAVPEDEVAGLVIAGRLDTAGRPSGSYDRWLADHQVDGAGAVIGVVDAGVDVDHPAFAGRIRDLAAGRRDWHGTMVAGHAAGAYRPERDRDGFVYGLGTAPAARLLSQDRDRAASEVCGQTVAEAGGDAAIQNNSWGRGYAHPMDYGSEEALYDALARDARGGGGQAAPLTLCFSAGNGGANGLTRPKAAKNVIVTGNSENHRPFDGQAAADDIREVYTGDGPSSQGNCADGRIRPHVVAPGEWTSSANFDTAPGQLDYVSPMIAWGGGSSGASPKTAGACALLAQWWRRWHAGRNPSPAMLRALVVNGAEPISSGGPVPNQLQGWGRLSLRELLDPEVARLALDQADLLVGPGDTRQWPVRVADPRRPVKVTLAWTDPPGAVGTGTAASNPVVNRLALRVTDGSRTWRGVADRLRGGWTADDAALAGAAGPRGEGTDNLQCVFLPPGAARSLVVSVTALSVTTDALTGAYDTPRQDCALVVTNADVDRAVTPTGVVTAVATAGAGDGDARAPDEAAWWAGGEADPGGGDAPAAEEALRGAAVALDATGNGCTVLPAAPGLAEAAEALRRRLPERARDAAVVLGLPDGAPVTPAAADALRSLAGLTDVHLVAAGAGPLADAAAALGPHPRFAYHLADGPAGLAAALAGTARDAAGLQRLVLGRPSLDGTAMTLRFGVVGADRTLVLTLPPGARDISVLRPGRPAAAPGADGDGDGDREVRTVRREEAVELVVDDAGATPGSWTVKASLPAPGTAPAVDAWVSGGTELTVAVPEVAPGMRLLRVGAGPGVLLRQLSVPRGRLDAPPGGPAAAESDRPLVVRARVSRLGQLRRATGAEDAAEVAVPALGTVVAVPGDGRTVLDVPVDVIGVDADGTAFARRTRATVVAAAGRSVREAAGRSGGGPPLRVTGRITGVRRRGGAVVGVRVTDGRHTRELSVRSPRLGAAAAALERGDALVLSVRGTELHAVYRPFAAVPGAGP